MSLTPQVKSSLLTALFTSIFIMILYSILIHVPYFGFSPSAKSPLFTAEGTGTAVGKPDQSQINFSVNKTLPTLIDAQNAANGITNTIIADVQKLGIDKKDIKTNNYSSNPNYNTQYNGGGLETPNGAINQQGAAMMPIRQPNNQTIISYTVSENVVITVKDSTKVNMVIDQITKDNAENINGPDYTFSDNLQKSLQDQARANAIINAKQKAQSIADAAGIHLGRITNIQEGNNVTFPVGVGGPIMMKSAGTVNSNPTNIQPGENTITDTVTLSYETY